MSAKKHTVLFLSPYPYGKASSQRLKYEQYFRYFEEHGFELTTSSFVNDKFWAIIYKKNHFLQKVFYTLVGYFTRFKDLFRLRRYDMVYVHLWATPLGPPIYEFLVCLIAKKVIYDIDDLIYLGQNKGAASVLWKIVKGKYKSLYLIRRADHVITCTPYLNEVARKVNPNATDISSTIDTDRFIPLEKYSNDHVVTLGWTGTHSTFRYLQLIGDILREVASKRKIKLIIIGDFQYTIEGVDTEMIQWTSKNEIADLRKIDIGLYPLTTDNWVLGKSGLKALQYMAIGIPAVATNIGTIHRIIEHRKSGILVTTKEEWVEGLIELIDHPELRERIGKEGRKVVENNFSIKANRDTYLNILKAQL